MNLNDKITLKKEFYDSFSSCEEGSWKKEIANIIDKNEFLTLVNITSKSTCFFKETCFVLNIDEIELFNNTNNESQIKSIL